MYEIFLTCQLFLYDRYDEYNLQLLKGNFLKRKENCKILKHMLIVFKKINNHL